MYLLNIESNNIIKLFYGRVKTARVGMGAGSGQDGDKGRVKMRDWDGEIGTGRWGQCLGSKNRNREWRCGMGTRSKPWD